MAMAEWYDDHVFSWQEIANQFFGVVVPFHIPPPPPWPPAMEAGYSFSASLPAFDTLLFFPF